MGREGFWLFLTRKVPLGVFSNRLEASSRLISLGPINLTNLNPSNKNTLFHTIFNSLKHINSLKSFAFLHINLNTFPASIIAFIFKNHKNWSKLDLKLEHLAKNVFNIPKVIKLIDWISIKLSEFILNLVYKLQSTA